MNIHIVCKNLEASDQVLARMALALAEATGWTIGEKPDPNATVNYFMPYLVYEPVKTKTAAWFTHYDPTNAKKAKRWEEVAAAVDLRVSLSPMYLPLLRTFGASEFIPPYVEKQFFKAQATFNPDNPTVGVSGFVYGDGRKGEDLVERLVQDRFCRPLRWKASGKGWPIKDTRLYEWQQMAGFYASLDVLVVTSRIEGGPLGPFEALAAGCKVVIPRGVGVLDELPDVAGVYRFEAGDYESLHKALDEALMAGRVDQKQLREAVTLYTPHHWGQRHRAALDGYFTPRPEAYVVQDVLPVGKCGVYYVAYGGPARACAVKAIESWKQHMPTVPVALVSDEPLDAGEDVFIEQPDADLGGRIAKIRIDELAPKAWEYVLYLDADTEIVGDVSFLYQLVMDGWDFAICKDSSKYATTRNMIRPDNKEEVAATWALMGHDDLLQLNGGVFAYRRGDVTKRFFEAWVAEWHRWGKRDQGALLRALHLNPMRVYVLGNEWNTVTRYYDPARSAGILHYPMTARRWNGHVYERLDSPEAFERIIK